MGNRGSELKKVNEIFGGSRVERLRPDLCRSRGVSVLDNGWRNSKISGQLLGLNFQTESELLTS